MRRAPIYRRGEAVEGRDTGGGRPAAIYGAQGVAERRDARFAASTRRLGQRHGEQEEGEHVKVAAAAWGLACRAALLLSDGGTASARGSSAWVGPGAGASGTGGGRRAAWSRGARAHPRVEAASGTAAQ